MARSVAGLVQTGVSDHLGVVIGIFDADGHPVWQGQSDIWGGHRSPEGVVSPWQFRWPGQYFDSETGLSYNRYRYYDPDTGTYCSTDPLGLAGGLRRYAYVADVLTHIDPHGLMANNACGKNAANTGRIFASPDPLVADVANEIERAYPGHVIGANVKVLRPDGTRVTDFDIELSNAIIQVKSGPGKGDASQVSRTIGARQAGSRPVILYGPDLGKYVMKDAERRGGLATRSLQDLIEVVAP